MINAAELIHIYLVHGYVLLASKVACEYIEAVQGNGKEYFGLKTALHTTSPPVWLPFNLFDQLLLELKDHSDEPIYQKVLYLYLYNLHILEIRSIQYNSSFSVGEVKCTNDNIILVNWLKNINK